MNLHRILRMGVGGESWISSWISKQVGPDALRSIRWLNKWIIFVPIQLPNHFVIKDIQLRICLGSFYDHFANAPFLATTAHAIHPAKVNERTAFGCGWPIEWNKMDCVPTYGYFHRTERTQRGSISTRGSINTINYKVCPTGRYSDRIVHSRMDYCTGLCSAHQHSLFAFGDML